MLGTLELGDGKAIDETAFRAFFTALAPEVRRWAARTVGIDAADDVVAETFVVAWQRRDQLPSEGDHRRAWIFVVARHKAAHARSRQGRDSALWRRLADAPDSGVSSDIADGVVSSSHAEAVLRDLSKEDREVLLLVGVDGLSPEDAAAVLGCSTTAMTTRLSRARRRLESRLREAEPAEALRRVP